LYAIDALEFIFTLSIIEKGFCGLLEIQLVFCTLPIIHSEVNSKDNARHLRRPLMWFLASVLA
jgi:hypothetical protein